MSTSSSRLSIVTPVYGTAFPYLLECMRSVERLFQDPRSEILLDAWTVVIDGDERPVERLLKSSKLYPKHMRVVRLDTNMGLAAAKNAGAKIAQGDHLTWLDADDAINSTNFLEFGRASLIYLDSDQYFMVVSDNFQCDEGLRVIARRDKSVFISDHNAHRATMLDPLYSVDFIFPSQVVRHSDFDTSGGFREGLIGEDVEFSLRLSLLHSSLFVKHVPLCTYYYRRNPNGIVTTRARELRYQNLQDYRAAQQKLHLTPKDVPPVDLGQSTLHMSLVDAQVPVVPTASYNIFLPNRVVTEVGYPRASCAP